MTQISEKKTTEGVKRIHCAVTTQRVLISRRTGIGREKKTREAEQNNREVAQTNLGERRKRRRRK